MHTDPLIVLASYRRKGCRASLDYRIARLAAMVPVAGLVVASTRAKIAALDRRHEAFKASLGGAA